MKKIFIIILDLVILGFLGFASYRMAKVPDYFSAFLVFTPIGLIIIKNAISKK